MVKLFYSHTVAMKEQVTLCVWPPHTEQQRAPSEAVHGERHGLWWPLAITVTSACGLHCLMVCGTFCVALAGPVRFIVVRSDVLRPQ